MVLTKSRFPVVLMIALALTPLISVYLPRFIAFWPIIIGLGTSYWLIFIKKELFRISRLYYVCAGVICVLCLLSAIWSVSPIQSLQDAIKVTAILMSGGLLVSSFKALDVEDLKSYSWMLPVGVITAAAFCIFDLYNGLTVYNIFHHHGEKITNTSVMNRGIICLVFVFFLSLPFIQHMRWTEKRKTLLTVISGIFMVIMLSLGQSQAGQLAFIVGLLAFFVFPARWHISYILLGFGLFVTLLMTPLITNFLYDNLIMDYQDANFFIREAFVGNRAEIWHFVMKCAMNNPLYGHGIESTGYIHHFDFEHIYNRNNTVLHPHNFSVQLWMEFGIIGIIVASAVFNTLLYVLCSIDDIMVRKTLSVLFVITLLVAAITYGLWQSWWLGEFIFILGMGSLMSNMQADAGKPE